MKYLREREENSSDEERDSVTFIVGGSYEDSNNSLPTSSPAIQTSSLSNSLIPITNSVNSINVLRQSLLNSPPSQLIHQVASVER